MESSNGDEPIRGIAGIEPVESVTANYGIIPDAINEWLDRRHARRKQVGQRHGTASHAHRPANRSNGGEPIRGIAGIEPVESVTANYGIIPDAINEWLDRRKERRHARREHAGST